MSGSSGEAFLQQTIDATNSTIQHVTMHAEMSQQLPLYLHLAVWDDADEMSLANPLPRPVTELRPGRRYHARLRSIPGRVNGQLIVQRHNAFELRLISHSSILRIEDDRVELNWEQASQFKHEFKLTVPENEHVPNTSIELCLHHRELSSPDPYLEVEPLIICPLQIAGTFNPIEPELLKRGFVDLSAERPEKTAVVRVQHSSEPGKIKLTCFGHYADHNISTEPFVPPNVRLADFVAANEHPESVLSELRSFSDSTANIEFESLKGSTRRSPLTLMGWIDILYDRLGEDFQLVIEDHTDSEIPWELLEIEAGRYLGVVVPIVRWLPIPLSAKGHWKLKPNNELCTGSVIAYLDEGGLSNVVVEQQTLNAFATQFHSDMDHLYSRLKDSLAGVGLIYLAYHGMFTPDSSDSVPYGSRNNPNNRLLPLRLEKFKSQDARPILFVNACHSGRVIKQGLGLYGLPIVSLKRIASGYIGVLGPVGSEVAARVANYIFRAIGSSKEGAKPAELLRKLRALAVEKLEADWESIDYQLDVIYTFMYVYYGNPLTQLQLLPNSATGAAGDDHE